MPWYVLRTKSRTEKLVAEKLTAMGVHVFCPLIRKERQWSDRKKIVELPLFPSYCFVNLPENERDKAFRVSGVVRYLFWLNKPAVVRDEEIETIRFMLSEVSHCCIQVESFQPGEKLTISSGPFYNTIGEVLGQQGRTVVLKLNALQMVLKVDLSKTLISK